MYNYLIAAELIISCIHKYYILLVTMFIEFFETVSIDTLQEQWFLECGMKLIRVTDQDVLKMTTLQIHTLV